MKENRFDNGFYVDQDDGYFNYLNENLEKINFALETKFKDKSNEEKVISSETNTYYLPYELDSCVSRMNCSSHKVSFSNQSNIKNAQNVHKNEDSNEIEIYYLPTSFEKYRILNELIAKRTEVSGIL